MDIFLTEIFDDNYVPFVTLPGGKEAFVVDPGRAEEILARLQQTNTTLHAILITHHHPDHIGGVKKLVEATGCKRVLGPSYDTKRIPGITEILSEGDKVHIGGFEGVVFFTPGHTSGHICYYFAKEQTLFCGDTLFSVGCGRLFEGTPEEMWDSLQKLTALPDDTRIYCAHEYTLSNIKFAESVEPDNKELSQYRERCLERRAKNLPTVPAILGLEKRINPFLNAGDVNTFAERRKAKDHFR